jgi:hypothetical protein
MGLFLNYGNSNKMNTKILYPYLRETLSQFLESKSKNNVLTQALMTATESYQRPLNEKTKHIIERLKVSTEAFYDQYLMQWSNLSEDDLRDVVHHWNLINAPDRKMVMTLQPTNDYIARDWTFVNVVELNLFEAFEENWPNGLPDERPPNLDWLTNRYGGLAYAMPYKQCRYCGRVETDPRGKAFGKQDLMYCHQRHCPTADANPAAHAVDCCYGQWSRIKRNFLKRCHRAKENPEQVKSLFLAFCQARYESNLAMAVRVQTEKVKPTDWINYDDYLSFVPYQVL